MSRRFSLANDDDLYSLLMICSKLPGIQPFKLSLSFDSLVDKESLADEESLADGQPLVMFFSFIKSANGISSDEGLDWSVLRSNCPAHVE